MIFISHSDYPCTFHKNNISLIENHEIIFNIFRINLTNPTLMKKLMINAMIAGCMLGSLTLQPVMAATDAIVKTKGTSINYGKVKQGRYIVSLYGDSAQNFTSAEVYDTISGTWLNVTSITGKIYPDGKASAVIRYDNGTKTLYVVNQLFIE